MKYLELLGLMYDPELWEELLDLNKTIFEFWRDFLTL